MRVAIIGLGEAGSTLHLPALSAMPDATVVGVCDSDGERLSSAVARWSVQGFEHVDRLLDETRPEAVIICTPPHTHAPLCLRALAAGAHVVCEKPFVSTLAEADAVLHAAAEARRQVAVNHEFREMPIYQAALDACRSGRDGALVFAQVWQSVDLPPWNEHGWRSELTRRTLFEAGVHLLDLLVAAFGEFPSSVQTAIAAGRPDADGRDPIVVATFEFPGGRLGLLVQNRLCKGERQYFELRADFERASWRASFGGRARVSAGLHRSSRPHVRLEYGVSGLAWRETGSHRTLVARNPRHPNTAATRIVLERTFAAFRDGLDPPTSGRLARRLLELIDACYESAATGRRVVLGPAA